MRRRGWIQGLLPGTPRLVPSTTAPEAWVASQGSVQLGSTSSSMKDITCQHYRDMSWWLTQPDNGGATTALPSLTDRHVHTVLGLSCSPSLRASVWRHAHPRMALISVSSQSPPCSSPAVLGLWAPLPTNTQGLALTPSIMQHGHTSFVTGTFI